MTAFQVTYGSGYCTIVEAVDAASARRKAGMSRVPGDWIARVSAATADELEWFAGSGGEIR